MIKTNKTTDYTLFKMADNNRAYIRPSHVKHLIKSIEIRDLTEYKPITVNPDYTIVDGQHRFLACKELKKPIYYQIIEENSTPYDLISLNVSLPWNLNDYLNYWVKEGNKNYIHLQAYIKKTGLLPTVVFKMIFGRSKKARQLFKEGLFVYKEDDYLLDIDIVTTTRDIIKKHTKMSLKDLYFINSVRFLDALMDVMKHPDFDKEKWYRQLVLNVDLMTPKATYIQFKELILHIYNYKQKNKLQDLKTDFDE